MKPCVVYFSRTGNTKQLAEAIAETAKAPVFSISEVKPAALEACDTLILGMPVEGASPAKEMQAFVDQLPTVQGKKSIVFCTWRLFGNERTMKAIEKKLAGKGYETILKTSKKFKPNKPVDLSDCLAEVKKVCA